MIILSCIVIDFRKGHIFQYWPYLRKMLVTTKGIVFKYFKYSESSIIAKVFTEKLGLQSYIVKGVRSKRSQTKLALFQPLTLVELVAFHKENKSIHHLKEVRVAYAYQSIPMEMEKRSILLFLNELLYKSVQEETANSDLFDWLLNALTILDLKTDGIVNYHLIFMLHLSRFLGFYPKKTPNRKDSYFDLQEGRFVAMLPNHPQHIGGELVLQMEMLHQSSFENCESLEINNKDRRKLLDVLITYFRLHLPGFSEMKSLDILKTIMS